MTWRTIWIPNIWTINRLFSVQFSVHHLNTGPFDNRTQIHHLNLRQVRYTDCNCTRITKVSIYRWWLVFSHCPDWLHKLWPQYQYRDSNTENVLQLLNACQWGSKLYNNFGLQCYNRRRHFNRNLCGHQLYTLYWWWGRGRYLSMQRNLCWWEVILQNI